MGGFMKTRKKFWNKAFILCFMFLTGINCFVSILELTMPADYDYQANISKAYDNTIKRGKLFVKNASIITASYKTIGCVSGTPIRIKI
jgi:hypothetical protein